MSSVAIQSTSQYQAGALAILFASLLWGTTGTAASFAHQVSPLAIGAFAMGFGGVIQAMLSWRRIRHQLHQILMNLCVNARDAMPNGGQLTIEARNFIVNEEYARLHLDAELGSYLKLTVTDTGVGIPPQIIDRIFEPFFTTKEIGKGTGLGLSISRGIVEAHNGKLAIDNKRENTTFVLNLPKKTKRNSKENK